MIDERCFVANRLLNTLCESFIVDDNEKEKNLSMKFRSHDHDMFEVIALSDRMSFEFVNYFNRLEKVKKTMMFQNSFDCYSIDRTGHHYYRIIRG